MTSPARKGRDFELSVHKTLKVYFGENVHMRAWSGTKAEPGDLYTKHLLIDCKNVQNFSVNDIVKWYDKIESEAQGEGKIPIIIHKRGRGTIDVIVDVRYIMQEEEHNKRIGIARFFTPSGYLIMQTLEMIYEQNIQKATSP